MKKYFPLIKRHKLRGHTFMKTPVINFLFVVAVATAQLPVYASDAGAINKEASKVASSEPDVPLYIDNVHIVDVSTGDVVKHRQLKIRNGKIIDIKSAQTPITDKNHILHDGKGQYVTPGLVDMHVHTYDPATFTIALSHGVTHLRIMNGVADHLNWRKELAEGSRIGSTVTVSSPIISSFKNAHMHYSAHTPAEATAAVVKAKQQGYDLIKAYGNLSAPVLNALLSEAKKQTIPVAKHGPHPADGMAWNALADVQSLEHVEDIYQGPLDYTQDQQKLDETIATLKALQVPITPTLNIFWQLTQISEHKQAYIDELPEGYISPIIGLEAKHNQVKRWLKSSNDMVAHNKKTFAFLQDITRQLYEAELLLLVGSDSGVLLSPHGLATHNEMALMQQAGLPAIAVLRAATINAAKALGKERQSGLVAPGFEADLVLAEQNPLENLATLQRPMAVIKGGRLFSKIELEQLRKKAIAERSFWQELNTLRKAW
jgi:imidazolonepropionase-like amidohydrolase